MCVRHKSLLWAGLCHTTVDYIMTIHDRYDNHNVQYHDIFLPKTYATLKDLSMMFEILHLCTCIKTEIFSTYQSF